MKYSTPQLLPLELPVTAATNGRDVVIPIYERSYATNLESGPLLLPSGNRHERRKSAKLRGRKRR